MAYRLKQSSTSRPLYFFMVQSSDGVTGKTGISPTVTICKNGGSFASPSGAISEIGNGWYQVAGNATDTGTLGPLLLHATGSGADPCDAVYEVCFDNPDAVIPAVTAVTNAITLPTIPSGWISASGLAADTGLAPIRTGTAQGGASGSITLDASAVATDNYYVGQLIRITSGPGVGEVRWITAYNGTTKVATTAPNWITNPDNTSTFAILPLTSYANLVGIDGTTTASNAAVLQLKNLTLSNSTGHAFTIFSSASGGDGIHITTVNGHGIYAQVGGSGKAGIFAQATAVDGHGIYAYGGSNAADITLGHTLTISGNLSGKVLGGGAATIGGVGAYVLGNAAGDSVPKGADWTNTRAGLLDNLTNLDAAISSLNNLSALCNIYGSPLLEIPDSGSTAFAFTVVTRDNEGKLKDLDSSPTIAAANAAGTDRSGNLSVVSHPSTGRYTFTYTVSSADAEESLRITVSGAISSESRYIEWIGAVVNYDSLTTLAAIKAKTDQLAFTVANQVDSNVITKTGFSLGSVQAFSNVGTWSGNISGNVTGSVATCGTVTGNVNGSTNSIGTTGVNAIWNALTSGMTTSGSIGKRIADNLDVAVSSVSSTVVSGVGTLGALITKAIRYIFLGMRKDSAIKGDFATEFAEINADQGSGAGSFDNTTDSVQAIRDRGDAAWTTGSGGGGGGSTGDGAFPIDHNGGTGTASADITIYIPYSNSTGVGSSANVMKFTSDGTTGVADLSVRAYLASDYDAGTRTALATTRTLGGSAAGQWQAPLNLDPGTYYIIADAAGDGYQSYQLKVVVP